MGWVLVFPVLPFHFLPHAQPILSWRLLFSAGTETPQDGHGRNVSVPAEASAQVPSKSNAGKQICPAGVSCGPVERKRPCNPCLVPQGLPWEHMCQVFPLLFLVPNLLLCSLVVSFPSRWLCCLLNNFSPQSLWATCARAPCPPLHPPAFHYLFSPHSS